MLEVKELNQRLGTMTIQTENGSVMLLNGRIIMQMGQLTYLEQRKVTKIFKAIMKPHAKTAKA